MSQKTIKVPIITSISSTYLMTVHLVFHEDERNAYQCPFSSAYSLYHVKIHKPDRVQQFISITQMAVKQVWHYFPPYHNTFFYLITKMGINEDEMLLHQWNFDMFVVLRFTIHFYRHFSKKCNYVAKICTFTLFCFFTLTGWHYIYFA